MGVVAIVGYFVWNRIVASTHKGFVANYAGGTSLSSSAGVGPRR